MMILFVIGGDRRQLYLMRLLEEDGHTVFHWGLGQKQEASLKSAVVADFVILPLPVSRDGVHLNLPLSEETMPLEELWKALGKAVVLGGKITEGQRLAAKKQGVELLDYFDREEVQVKNALSTSEGAIQEAMMATDTTIHGSKILILGHGRIAKILAHHLRALGGEVSVAARRYSERSWAEVFGCTGLTMEEMEKLLGSFDMVFNTVPALLLGEEQLKRLKPACLVMELASVPGGIDAAAAREMGIRYLAAHGLPGKAAPMSAAAVLRDSIYAILRERGERI